MAEANLETDRGQWANNREFFLACLGYCVGLGNIWRFPYLCYANGGGAFVIAYILVAVFVGTPMYFLEIAIGQFTKSGPIGVYNLVPAMKGIGVGCAIVCFYFALYNVVVLAWGLLYMFHSFTTSALPWSTCGNWWNTDKCTVYTTVSESNASLNSNLSQLVPANESVLSSNEFWNNYVLRKSDGIEHLGSTDNWQLGLCFLLAWVLSYLCAFKGAKLTGKVVYFTAIFPYIVLTALVVRGCTLPGSSEGIKYYLLPNFTKLAESSVWIQAGSQVLYSYGIGFTVLIAFGSYSAFNTNCYKYSAILTSTCSMTSLYAGFCVFGVLGHLAHITGKNISEVVASGPGLAFQTYPAAVSLMPYSQFWSVLFFFMILIVGIDTQFTCIEGVICAIADIFPRTVQVHRGREKTTLAACILMCFLGIPFVFGFGIYIFQMLDNYSVGGFAVCTVVLSEVLTFAYIYGVRQLYRDIEAMIGYRPSIYLKICYLFIVPLMISTILVFSLVNYNPHVIHGYKYPKWAIGCGWMSITSILVFIPIIFFYELWKSQGTFRERIRKICTPRYPKHLILLGYKNDEDKVDISVTTDLIIPADKIAV